MLARHILLALVVATAVPLASAAAEEEGLGVIMEEEPQCFTLGTSASLVLGVTVFRPGLPALPDGWEARFRPRGGSMKTTNSRLVGDLRLWLIPEVAVSRGLRLGFPVGFGLSSLKVYCTKVSWWDPVTAQAIEVKATGPLFGISLAWGKWKEDRLRVGLKWENQWWRRRYLSLWEVQVTIIPHSLLRTDYEGVDVSGGRNWSRPIASTEIGRGLGQSLSVRRRWGESLGDSHNSPLWCHSVALVAEHYERGTVVLSICLELGVQLY